MIKLIVAGCRDYNNKTDFEEVLSRKTVDLLVSFPDQQIEIVSGGATGADAMAKGFAKLYQYEYKEFPADWKQHGKAAGPIRNQQMAEYGTHLLAFWDGKSKGTRDMINKARIRRLKVDIVYI